MEPGKNFQVTTDQFHLIVDYKIMEREVDKSYVIPLAERLLPRFKVGSWSFDKVFYSKDNKALLGLFIPHLVMPKKESSIKKSRNRRAKGPLKKYAINTARSSRTSTN